MIRLWLVKFSVLVPVAATCLWAVVASAGDWPQWCGKPGHNMVSDEKGLPEDFSQMSGKISALSGDQGVKWSAQLDGITCGSPVIAGGNVFIGGAGRDSSTAMLWCFRELDGQLLWKMRSPLCLEHVNRTFGICSTPTVEGDRVYLLGHLGEVLCLDANGLAGRQPSAADLDLIADHRECVKSEIAPDGHRIIECTAGKPGAPEPTDAHIIWRYDLLREVNCWPYNAQSGSILIRGDHLIVPTGSVNSGRDDGSKIPIDKWKSNYKQATYDSPSLIVLDKKTGKLLAREKEGIFERTFHGAQSSPALGVVGGKELIIYGGGDGTCYAFDPDFEPGRDGKPGVLKLVWKFDCLAPATYDASYVGRQLAHAEVIASPVIYKDRVYVSIGNDLINSGVDAKGGRLLCLNATKTGDITTTGKIWSFDDIRSTACTVAITGGLLYTGDAAGNIYCLDSETGKRYWHHQANSIWSSPLVADGKLFIADNTQGLLVFAAEKEKKLLSRLRVNTQMVSSPAVARSVLYIASSRYLYALQRGTGGALLVPAIPDNIKMVKEQRRNPWPRLVMAFSLVAVLFAVVFVIVRRKFLVP